MHIDFEMDLLATHCTKPLLVYEYILRTKRIQIIDQWISRYSMLLLLCCFHCTMPSPSTELQRQ